MGGGGGSSSSSRVAGPGRARSAGHYLKHGGVVGLLAPVSLNGIH